MVAGVDFSSGTFDNLYLYACAKSTTPHGLIQMSGRIRSIGSDVIMCCASKSVPLVSTASKVTVDEQLQFLRWCGDLALTLVPVRLQGGMQQFLPPSDATSYLLAANSARQYNSQTRFFAELQDLLQQTGHRVQVESSGIDMPVSDKKHAKEQLLRARDVDDDEFGFLMNKMVRRQCPEDDKWVVSRHIYKHVWGLRTVSEEFVDANGVGNGSQQVRGYRFIDWRANLYIEELNAACR